MDLEKSINQDVALLFNTGMKQPAAGTPTSGSPDEEQGFSLWHDGLKQVLGGAADAVNNVAKTVDDAWDWGAENFDFLKGLHEKAPDVPKLMPDVEQSKSTVGQVARGIGQFMTAFVPFSGALKAVGVAGKIARPLLAGAAADFSAFDPMQERFSNMIQGTALENPISEYLAAKEDDTAFEGRIKNVLEGMALGIPADLLAAGIGKVVKTMKSVGKAKEALTEGTKGAVEGTEQTVRGLPEGTVQVVKDPAIPLKDVKLTNADVDEIALWSVTNKPIDPSDTRILNTLYMKDSEKLVDTLNRLSDKVSLRFNEIPPTTLKAIEEDALNMGMTPSAIKELAGDVKNLPARMVAARQFITTGVDALDQVMKAIDAGDYTPQTLYKAELLTKNVGAAMGYFTGARKEIATTVTSFRIEVGSKGEMAKTMLDQINKGGRQEWEKVAKMWTTLDKAERLNFLANGKKAGWADALNHVYVNSLLSNPGTFVVNALSNVGQLIMHVGSTGLAATANAVTPWREGAVSFRDVKAQMFALVSGAWDAMKLGWQVFKGENPERLVKYDYAPVSSAAMGLDSVVGKSMDVMLKATGLPTRIMAGTDAMFKDLSMRMVYAEEAFKRAAEGKGEWKEILEGFYKNPGQDLMLKAEAERVGKVLTFQESTGTVGQAILGLRERVPALRLLVPFVTTPVNIVKQVAAMTPGLHMLSGSYAADIAAGGARAEVARAKLAMGSTLFGVTAMLAGNGLIVGGLDPTSQKARDLAGVPPYSMKVGDTWYQFNRLDPVGALLGMAADWTELIPRMAGQDSDKMMGSFVTMLSRYTLNRTYLKNVSDVLMALTQPEIYGPKLVQNLAGGMVPYSGTSSWFNRTFFDQDMREINSISDAILSRLPGFAEGLPPRRNPITGDPIKFQDRGFYGLSPFPSREQTDDPVMQEVGRLAPDLDWRTKHLSFMGNSIPLNPMQQDELKVVQTKQRNALGHTLHDHLAFQMQTPKYQAMNDEDRKDFIRDVVSKWRSEGVTKFKRANPDILAQMQAIRIAQK